MTLTSFTFLLLFPVVFLLHYLVFSGNRNLQNAFVLAASLVFYGWWDWRLLGFLLITAFSTFAAGMWMGKVSSDKGRRAISVACIVLNLGILFLFKYYNFFADSLADAFSLVGIQMQFSTLKLILPVGISFYTFSALSYSIDVFQRKVEPTNDILAYLAYVTFFPSILSGPIGRATKQLPQFMERRCFDYEKVVEGSKLLVWGLFVKLCAADRMGQYVNAVYGNLMQHTGVTFLLASVLYTLQIYADFAGYSYMAIGLGKMLGIDLQQNFKRPYLSATVTEFWRRWHISLTTWFRDYIYIPLGGNRCSHSRWVFNVLIVFLVSGLWHGAAYTFLVWGLFHGLCMVIERSFSGKFSMPTAVKVLITFATVNFAWIFFRSPDLQSALYVFKQIVTAGGGKNLFIDITTLATSFMALGFILLKDFADEYGWRVRLLHSDNKYVGWGTIVFLICYTLFFGVLNGGSFIYFQF